MISRARDRGDDSGGVEDDGQGGADDHDRPDGNDDRETDDENTGNSGNVSVSDSDN